MEGLTINEAAETTGWSPRMLRYIENAGLIEPARTSSGYRLFGAEELQRLRTLRELLAQFDCALSDVAFAERMRSDRSCALPWSAGSRSARSPPRGSRRATGSRWEQEKHERLLEPDTDHDSRRTPHDDRRRPPTADYKVADISLAEFGRKEITSPSTRCPA